MRNLITQFGCRIAAITALYAAGLLQTANAQTVTLPPEVKVGVGRLASVPITYDGTDLKWEVPPSLDAFREYTTDPKEVRLRVIGYQVGAYRLIAVTTKDGKLSPFGVCVVLVGEVPPTPPGPGPIPPPGPTDPFTKSIQDAYTLETDPLKTGQKTNLAALYRQAGGMAVAVHDLRTWGQLFDAMKSAAATLGVSGKLSGVQKVIQGKLTTTIPTDGTIALDETGRQLAKKTFDEVATALEAAK